MSQVETPYVIGVLREWEKGLLENDEYTRLIDAESEAAAVHVLADTPYGQWLGTEGSLEAGLQALERHLEEVYRWLADRVDDERVGLFIAARYDGLNVATAWLQYQRGDEQPGPLSPLGSFSAAVLQSALWNDIGWEALPEGWERLLRELKEDKPAVEVAVTRVAQLAVQLRRQAAFTPLMRDLAALAEERETQDATERPLTDATKAGAYERNWDEKLLALLRKYRLQPVGYDSILAFWYAKELEAKQLRLLLSAKASGVGTEELRAELRGLYRSLA